MFCRLFKMMISHAADMDKPLGGIAQTHTERCESCRRFYESCRLLEDGLRAEAMDLSSNCELPTERIIDGLSGSSKRSRHVPIRLKRFAAAACIALAATAGIMFISKPPEPRPPAEPPLSISDLLPTDLEATWAEFVEEPLAGEMVSLADDTESVIRFLVACIDVDPLQNGTTYQQHQ
jgi:hypothetical protein